MPYTTNPRIATTLFAIVIFFFGLNHLIIPEIMVEKVPAFFPYPLFLVYFVGVVLIACSLALITHKKVNIAGYVLAGLIITIALFVHLNDVFHAGSKDEQKLSVILLAKDIAIAAAAFYIGSKNE